MPEKKEETKEAFGIIGLTLGILGILLVGSNGILISATGLIFSIIQQRRYKTKIGKAGIIVGTIGLILGIIFLFVFVYYITPMIKQQLQNFPIA